jgi:hypothetical protein
MVCQGYLGMRRRTKPVRHKFLQISWAEACEAAGFKGQYQLRYLRKKGLTDEFLSQGENNKGGHESPQMRKHYRLIRPPEQSKSTLKSLRETGKIKKSFVGNTPVIFRNRKQLKRKGKNGGAGRNRTGVHGVAGRTF